MIVRRTWSSRKQKTGKRIKTEMESKQINSEIDSFIVR